MVAVRPLFLFAALFFTLTTTGCRKEGPPKLAKEASVVDIVLISTDTEGRLTDASSQKLPHLLASASDDGVTDVFILAHGWNNSSTEAEASYRERFGKLHEASLSQPESRPSPYKPLVIGLIWPSKAWDFGPAVDSDSVPPTIGPTELAALDAAFPPTANESETQRKHDLDTISKLSKKKKSDITTEDRLQAFTLFAKYSIKPSAIRNSTPDDQNLFDRPAPDAGTPLPDQTFPTIGDAARVFTFWQMKKRAGIVGENGGALVLRSIFKALPQCRVHLIGHSFGAKLQLSSALAYASDNSPQKLSTIILLQGAISYQAFAEQVTGLPNGTSGGYKAVLKVVNGPIVATFSSHDKPLTLAYPIGAGWKKQVGEVDSNRFSALGAVGIDGIQPAAMKAPKATYGFLNEAKLVSINGSTFIPGHSDVSSPEVAWMQWAAASRR